MHLQITAVRSISISPSSSCREINLLLEGAEPLLIPEEARLLQDMILQVR